MNDGTKPHPLANLTAAARASYERPQPSTLPPPHYRPPQPSVSYAAPSQPIRQASNQSEIVISPSSNDSSPAAGAAGSAVSNGTGGAAPANGRPQSSGGSQVVPVKRPTLDEDGAEKKRSRQALSCSECKRRKIKCDRKVPCEACIKRGNPSACSWEEAKIDPAPQPFALVTDLRKIAERLASVEAFLQTLPPELRANAPKPSLLEGASVVTRGPLPHPALAQTAERDDDTAASSDMEDAALALEGAAFSMRAPGPHRYRPVDSVPFLENPTTYGAGCISSSLRAPRRNDGSGSDSARPQRELTSAYTCIIADPLVVDNPAVSAAQMGLDIDVDAETLPGVWKAALERTIKPLPASKEISTPLVLKFFSDFGWMHNMLHQETFLAEHDFYWNLVDTGRQLETCPIWLALYSVVLALAYDGSLAGYDKDLESAKNPAQATKLYAVAHRLLDLGDWRGRPQARSVYTILMIAQFQQLCASTVGGQATRFLSLIAGAVRIAQILGLHQLGSSDEIMPPDDPAWPPGKNSMKRQAAIRLWSTLTFIDCMSSTVRFRSYMIHIDQVTTAPIANVDFDELSPTEWKITEQPRSVITDGTFDYFKCQIGIQSRKVFDKLVTNASSFSYDTVLELDREYRDLLAQIPAEDPEREGARPYLRWKRLVCSEAVQSRICRLHRPFLTRGFNSGSRFAFSAEKCVEAAQFVISNVGIILGWSPNAWFIFSHALGATIVLFADLFHSIDKDASEHVIECKKNVLVKAYDIFSRHSQISAPGLRVIVQQGRRIMSGLFMAEEKRRATRAACTLSNNTPAQPVESFAQVLQHISREIEVSAAQDLPLPTPSPAPSSTLNSAPLFTFPIPSAFLPPPANDPISQEIFGGSGDTFTSQFFRDLGLPPTTAAGSGNGVPATAGGEGWSATPSTFDFWSQGTGSSGGTGVTPPDFSFLSGTNDWAAGGQALDFGAVDPNALAANALLDQLAGTW
ncbi:hypothetical protein BCR35DRAFT_304422 [Leucosporidium creatinivorum]|uniref:Zn(2)-C6 fungal-type domain-containing protein n=1 Tax=Leucosporidium creatinivorum TaxID=106004 RepID=A0A1Y2F8K0_9BASI|nr:hypothetical protein BCR35DRAFT_304422 [Leucosporidium creatinivorum]